MRRLSSTTLRPALIGAVSSAGIAAEQRDAAVVCADGGCAGVRAVDIRTTPESPVLKWGFVLLTAYTGVVGAFLYVLGCREPLPGLHERYVAARWRQTLGSTMHCVAGDGVGILAGAVLSSVFGLAGPSAGTWKSSI
jgi:hypothetical protein